MVMFQRGVPPARAGVGPFPASAFASALRALTPVQSPHAGGADGA